MPIIRPQVAPAPKKKKVGLLGKATAYIEKGYEKKAALRKKIANKILKTR